MKLPIRDCTLINSLQGVIVLQHSDEKHTVWLGILPPTSYLLEYPDHVEASLAQRFREGVSICAPLICLTRVHQLGSPSFMLRRHRSPTAAREESYGNEPHNRRLHGRHISQETIATIRERRHGQPVITSVKSSDRGDV